MKRWQPGRPWQECAAAAVLACLLPGMQPRAYCAMSESHIAASEIAGTGSKSDAARARGDFTDLVLEVEVNGLSKGEFFMLQDPSGGYWIDSQDWARLGVRDAPPQSITLGQQRFFALGSIPGIGIKFDPGRLKLGLEFPGAALGTMEINLQAPLERNVLRPRNSSGFFNYRLGAFRFDEHSPTTWNLDTELGLRYDDVLFQNTTSSTRTGSADRTVRLFTNFTHDNREDLQRLVVGDFIAPTTDLGSALTMGGVSLSKQYSINPYLIKVPTANFLGAVGTPAEVRISLDGIPLRTERLPPGQFDIRNLNYFGGYRDVQIVVRDRLGQQQTIGYPYYFTDALLAQGYHEYSYNLGFLREEFGVASNDYGNLAASAFHRYGYTDDLTLGAHAAATGDRFNIGPDMAFRLAYYGVFSASATLSQDSQQGEGWAGSLGYSFDSPHWHAVLSGRSFSRDYTVVGDLSGAFPIASRKLETLALVGYNSVDIGSVSVGYSTTRTYGGVNDEFASLSYTRSFFGNLSLSATLLRRPGGQVDAFAGLTYTPNPGYTANYQYQRRDGVDQNRAEFQRNLPLGEGYGYSLAVENDSGGGLGGVNLVSPFVQYNGAYGTLAAGFQAQSGGPLGSTFGYNVAASGSISYVGGNWNVSRPITDSFAVVKVGDIEGVGVYQNSQLIAATDKQGTVLLPDLGSYVNNQITINDHDVPFEYELKELTAFVSPPLRSGSLVAFEAKRVHAATGRLKVRVGQQLKPLENSEFTLVTPAGDRGYATGKGGEFYVDDLSPGDYPGSSRYDGLACRFQFAMPGGTQPFVNIGEIICEPTH